jgi:hypothetical protein
MFCRLTGLRNLDRQELGQTMSAKRRRIAAVGVAVAIGAVALGAAGASGRNDDDDVRATGPAADRAARTALARFPGARVAAVERDSDGGPPWEVELTRANGTTVDVELDSGYRIVAVDEDRGPDDTEIADDDDGAGADDPEDADEPTDVDDP